MNDLKWINYQQKLLKDPEKLDNSTDLVICTGFPTLCEVKYDILVKKITLK